MSVFLYSQLPPLILVPELVIDYSLIVGEVITTGLFHVSCYIDESQSRVFSCPNPGLTLSLIAKWVSLRTDNVLLKQRSLQNRLVEIVNYLLRS
jgi:hypothetical protein